MKSSYSAHDGGCVDTVRDPHGNVVISHSLSPMGMQVAFSRHEWEMFLKGVHDGEFDYESIPVEGTDHIKTAPDSCPSCSGPIQEGPEPWCRRTDLHGRKPAGIAS